MATFTITTAQNIDALSVKTGGDVYNINGGTLTIDQDSRVGLNQTTSTSLGSITLSASLGGTVNIDGSLIRLIPYNTGTGNVPAWNTTISQGGASGLLIGVYSSLTAASTATGAAMPASGYIKIKQWNSVAYTSGALTGISASATGADVVGWLEIVGDDAATVNANRLGQFNVTGAWYQIGTTSGVSNQTMQIPSSGVLQHVAGVFIEQTVGGEDYEFYPNAGIVTTTGTEADRGKCVWIDNTGLVRIGNSGAATNGYTPVTGLKVVIGNVFFRCCTTAARTANVIPNATIATRYDFTTTGGGVIDLDKCDMAWYLSCSQAYSVNVSNSGFIDGILLSEVATPMTFTNMGVGNKPTTALVVAPLTMTLCLAGGTFEDCRFQRVATAANSSTSIIMTDCDGFTFTRMQTRYAALRGHTLPVSITATRVNNCTFDTLKMIDGQFSLVTCANLQIDDTIYIGGVSGTTSSTFPCTAFLLTSNCLNITIDGLTLPVTNNQPYAALFSIGVAGCTNTTIRNIGTYASPLSLGSASTTGLIFTLVAGAAAVNTKVQRVYCSNVRTGIMTGDNSSKGLIMDNVFGDYADAADVSAVINMSQRGLGGTKALTAQTGIYGTHWIDYFTSTTAGRLGIVMNETTTQTSSQVTLANGAAFTSAGGLYMPVIGHQAIFETPDYIIGHTGFSNSALVMAGGTVGNYRFEYSIDLNDGNGYSAMTASAYTAANLGTALNAETVDPIVGFKLKLQIDTTTTNATAITSVYMPMTSTTTTQAYQYPLSTASATFSFSGLEIGTEVVLFDNTGAEIDREVIASTTYEYPYEWNSNDGDLTGYYALIWKDDKYPIVFDLPDLGETDTNVPIAQAQDLVYNATYTPNSTVDFANQLIIMDTGAVEYSVPEVYSYWKDELRLTNNAQYGFAYSIVGGDTISGPNSIPKYTFQANGWKVRPDEANHTLEVTDGVLVGESGADPFVDTLGAYTVRINYQQPVQAIAVSTGGGGGATAADVWAYATRTLSTGGVTAVQSGLATEANATTNTGSIVTILNALNDIAPSEVLTQVTNALNSYDPPTKAEMDAEFATVAQATDLAKLATKGDLAALD